MKNHIPIAVQKALRLGFLLTAALATIMMAISFFVNFQSESHYFTKDGLFPTLAICFACIATVIGIADALLTQNASLKSKNSIKIAPLFAGIGFLVYGIYQIATAATNLSMVCAIMLIIAAVHCVFAFFNKKEFKQLTFYLGIAAVLGCALLTIILYFDMTLEMNAPIKVLPQIALLCAMLFFTSELRCYIDRPAPRAYRVFCIWSILSCALSSLPILIACLMGKIDRLDILFVSILLLGIAATTILRWISIFHDKKSEATIPPQPDQNDQSTDFIY